MSNFNIDLTKQAIAVVGKENIATNLLAQTLKLTAEDMAQIAALERNGREVPRRSCCAVGLKR